MYLFIGLAIGIVFYFLAKSKSISTDDYLKLQNELQSYKTHLDFADSNRDRLERELQISQNELREFQLKFNQILEEKSVMKAQFESILQSEKQKHSDLQNSKLEISTIQKQHHETQQTLARRDAELKYLHEKLQVQKGEIEEIRKQSVAEFQNLANKILDEKSQKFTQTNKENIETILKPLGENLDQFKKKVEETYDKESKERFSLESKVKELIELNNKLSNEANNLTRALKGDAKKMGNWGEIILESILEQSGLQKNREYVVQESIKDEEGKELRPDVLVYLPEERTIVIDSKVSLVAYDRYSSADQKTEQDEALRQHIISIRNHIDDLSRKKYESLVKSLDFVMMFIPIEPAYLLAIQEDRELWSYAYQRRVLLISPTNLIAALKLVADLWKRESQNKNAIEIAKQGEKLLEKFLGFAESMEEIGRHINKTSESYGDAIKKLRDGRGNLVDQAMKLKKLGISSRKALPNSLLSYDTENDEIPEDVES